MTNAPVIVTVYDRLQHFQKCIAALQRNRLSAESELYVVSDASARPEHDTRIDQVRSYARSITGFKKVRLVFRSENMGACRSFRDLMPQVLEEHGRFIILEDDVIASPNFLDYMNDGLKFYETDKRIFSIAGYTHPVHFPDDFTSDVFFLPMNCPWGFATWKDRLDRVDYCVKDRYSEALADRDLYKKLISLGSYIIHILEADSKREVEAPDVRVAFHQIINNVYTVYPRVSKVLNIGLDGSGSHSGVDKHNKYLVQPDTSTSKTTFDVDVSLDAAIIRRICKFQNGNIVRHLITSIRLAKRRWLHERQRRLH